MGNFDFLEKDPAYGMFAKSAEKAEGLCRSHPSLSALLSRKTLELAVKWIYQVEGIEVPRQANLQSLLHHPDFRDLMDHEPWYRLQFIVKMGNLSAHEEREISFEQAAEALRNLFDFLLWIDYCYGRSYEERVFSLSRIPEAHEAVNEKRIREQARLLEQQGAEKERLAAELAKVQAELRAMKAASEENQAKRTYSLRPITELSTRQMYIDVDLQLAGWQLSGSRANVAAELPVRDMNGVLGAVGKADYVLFGKDGRPLAVVEAKRTSRDAKAGAQQAKLYADALEKMYGARPFIFLTNGFETHFWDDVHGTPRQVSGIFGEEDLARLMQRRSEEPKPLSSIPIDDRITNRAYQKEAIRATLSEIERGRRKHLLVMATGTGKTRTAASLVDVLLRGNRITRVLFLADRTALVSQAKEAFKAYLPEMSLCNLCSNKEDANARVVFSTYPTMLNAIDGRRTETGARLFTPAHFDLIIIDESHRSIFKKYRTIFDYFDAILVGLTATPKTDVDRNTYDFFERKLGVPTYAYSYEEAVTAHFLVPYKNYEVKTLFLHEGITYDKLTPEDRERYEEDFIEDDGSLPTYVSESKINRKVFNRDTVRTVIERLMEKGIKVSGGDRLGKTIIFAENKKHAQFIVDCFAEMYPEYHGNFARRIVCDDSYAETLIADFKNPDKDPVIAVSVDMMDTGIDVPECVNLVFFKKVRSKTKFWQMIGRGTRLAPDLVVTDGEGEHVGKRYFLIFDYGGNFDFFREHQEPVKETAVKSLSENLFEKRVRLIRALEGSEFSGEGYRSWRATLVKTVQHEVAALKTELVAVRLHLSAVETYKKEEAYQALSDEDVKELVKELAPLVTDEEMDEAAKRFDIFMYGMMLTFLTDRKAYERARESLKQTVHALSGKNGIQAVRDAQPLMEEIQSPTFFPLIDLLKMEEVRMGLRDLMQYLEERGSGHYIVTTLHDPVVTEGLGEPLAEEPLEDYRKKVEGYFTDHADDVPAVRKLVHNEPLTSEDYAALERIFEVELGTPEAYRAAYATKPFGLVVREIAKLDPQAAEQAFSSFINDYSLNEKQIAFVRQVINFLTVNGYIDSPARLMSAPFDRYSCGDIFSTAQLVDLSHVVNTIRDNAVRIVDGGK